MSGFFGGGGGGGGGAAAVFLTFLASQGVAPAANFATFAARNLHGILNFDQTTAESIIFEGVMPSGYNSANNLTVTIYWTSSVTTGSVVWSAAVEALDGSLDIDADGFATAVNAAAVATSATSGIRNVSTITLTNVQADAIAAGMPFRLQVARVPGDAGDDMAADAQFLYAVVSQ